MFCLDHFSLDCIIKMSNFKVNDPLNVIGGVPTLPILINLYVNTQLWCLDNMTVNKCWAWQMPFVFAVTYCILNQRFIDQQSVGLGEAMYLICSY